MSSVILPLNLECWSCENNMLLFGTAMFCWCSNCGSLMSCRYASNWLYTQAPCFSVKDTCFWSIVYHKTLIENLGFQVPQNSLHLFTLPYSGNKFLRGLKRCRWCCINFSSYTKIAKLFVWCKSWFWDLKIKTRCGWLPLKSFKIVQFPQFLTRSPPGCITPRSSLLTATPVPTRPCIKEKEKMTE